MSYLLRWNILSAKKTTTTTKKNKAVTLFKVSHNAARSLSVANSRAILVVTKTKVKPTSDCDGTRTHNHYKHSTIS